jgi:4a-hydroxytetrahydrobiopterin dehydratase
MPIFTKYKSYLNNSNSNHDLNKWGYDNNLIYRIFEFSNFSKAVEFINTIANVSEEIGHHPDILLYDYKFVKISYKSHDMNKITQDDYKCAHIVDQIYDKDYL